MTFTDYYLKFSDQTEADSVLFTEVPIEWDNSDPDNPVPTKWEKRQNFKNTDILPKVVEIPATFDSEGNELTPPVYEEGYFANVRLLSDEDGSSMDSFKVEPEHPQRIWA
tara:strand:- start:974 stop:1303 length:330 start_codon:yes stop_codon:yes gene_type:complete